MFGNRIEFESDDDLEKRYERGMRRIQRNYEFLWDLRVAFFGMRLLDPLVDWALRQLSNYEIEDIGRRRFFRVTNFFRIPLPSIHP
ncbi:hypothetical protein HYU96_03895 [Candidatus Daviesbacteria bacterium]|nr:hypothetical protein [Candidatus Daviesbacteria bacterium]